MIQGYHAYSLPMLHNWSAGHFSPSRFVLCCVFWLVLLVCFFFGLVLFFGFCYVTELWRHWTMYRSTTSLLLRPLISRRPSLRQLTNSLIAATCNRTCWTTWRKPRGVGRKKKTDARELISWSPAVLFFGVFFGCFCLSWLVLGFCCLLFFLARWQLNGLCIDPIQFPFVCTLSSWLMLPLL